jgi:hypothetical protein
MIPGGEYVDGVDVSLVRWMLSLSPSERLDVLEEFVDFVAEARKYNEAEPIPRGTTKAG